MFSEAKRRLGDLYERYPEASVVVSMQNQLDYLIQIESGESTDRSRLKEIVLGVQTAREIEPRDEETAAFMYEVTDAVQEMIRLTPAR